MGPGRQVYQLATLYTR
jgi:hypothetical protein